MISKKKKKVFMCTEAHFHLSTSSQDLLRSHPNFVWGVAIFVFRAKISLKTAKIMLFHILFRPMGGYSTICPPLATLLHAVGLSPWYNKEQNVTWERQLHRSENTRANIANNLFWDKKYNNPNFYVSTICGPFERGLRGKCLECFPH